MKKSKNPDDILYKTLILIQKFYAKLKTVMYL